MPQESSSPVFETPAAKIGNRRRRGYELTRQRNMVPIFTGAAVAALLFHAVLYVFFPDTFRLGMARYLVPPVQEESEMRVVVRDAPEEEIQADISHEIDEPQEIDEVAYEPDQVDILDAQINELEIAPGETQSAIDMPTPLEAEDASEEPAAPAAMDMQALAVETVSVESLPLAEPAPVNASLTVVNAVSDADAAADALEADLRQSAADAAHLPADTKALSELLGEKELGSKSGVARLGADLLFGFDECKLRNSARVSMLQLAALIQKNPETCFLIEGHTDSIGSPEYNALLGLQRAAAVRAWLEGNAIPTDRVFIRSCGNNSPLEERSGDRAKEALNRRVEIHMRKLGETIPAGFLPASYKVDTATAAATQIAAGVQIPTPAALAVPPPAKKKAPSATAAAPADLIPAPQIADTPSKAEKATTKPAAKSTPAKPAQKPASRAPVKKPAAKPAAKQTAPTKKPAAKPAQKPASKSASKTPVKKPAQPTTKKPANAKRR